MSHETSLGEILKSLDPVDAAISFFGKPKAYCRPGDYPLTKIIGIREDIKDALMNPEIVKECLESALDQLSELESLLLGGEK